MPKVLMAIMVFLSLSAPSYPGEDDLLYDAVVKLILKYDELFERVKFLEKRLSLLERQIDKSKSYTALPLEPEVDLRTWGRARTWVKLRVGPGKEYAQILVLRPKELVEILGKSGEWYKVKTKEGYVGYSHSQYVVEVRR